MLLWCFRIKRKSIIHRILLFVMFVIKIASYCTKAKKYLTQAGAKFHTVEIDKTEGMIGGVSRFARNFPQHRTSTIRVPDTIHCHGSNHDAQVVTICWRRSPST